MIDTHCHLTEPVLHDRIDQIIRDARAVGVDRFVVPSVDLATSRAAIDMARHHQGILPAVGIHPMWGDFPDDAGRDAAMNLLKRVIETNRDVVAAVGEIGLDPDTNGELTGARPEADLDRHARIRGRKALFLAQMELARECGLPVLLHWRGAYGRGLPSNETIAELVEILEHFGPIKPGGILHAFTGSSEIGARLRPLGWLRGVAGTVTRPDTPRIKAAISGTGIKDMVIETDAPFIANSVHGRGAVVPADMILTVQAVAAIKGLDVAEVVRITDENAATLFLR